MENDPVPPSSPPHAPAANLLDSPFPEPRYTAYSLKSSSPPPLFSSDDSRESADISNYESPRIFKNKRKGGWWDSGDSPHSPLGVKKAKITRNYDSGVYMMSDATDSSENFPVEHKSPFGWDGIDSTTSQKDNVASASLPKGPLNQQEHIFCRKLEAGLDKNSENYDFSSCDLRDQDIGRIGELASVIKNVPDPGDELPGEGQYRSLVPELYVSLKDNKLNHLAPSLFDVTTITSLILSDNEIEELPSEMRQLCDLKELNISNNKLRWLPFELLELYGSGGKLEILGDSGVPWLEPKSRQDFDPHLTPSIMFDFTLEALDCSTKPGVTVAHHLQRLHQLIDAEPNREQLLWHMLRFELWVKKRFGKISEAGDAEAVFPHHPNFKDTNPPKYMARTPVSYFDETGVVLRGSPVPPSTNKDDFAMITETDRGAHGTPASLFSPPDFQHTNSLATMALHTALNHSHYEDLSIQDLRERIGEPLPPVVDALLSQAERNDCAGFGAFRKCHVCSREYVIRRAEWIEWWISQSWKMFPFKVRVCSWACVPDEMRHRPAKELNWSSASAAAR